MEALGWALIGLVSLAWLGLFHGVRNRVGFEHERGLPTLESSERAAVRPARLWLDYKPPTA
jgi:hypothetical protein